MRDILPYLLGQILHLSSRAPYRGASEPCKALNFNLIALPPPSESDRHRSGTLLSSIRYERGPPLMPTPIREAGIY